MKQIPETFMERYCRAIDANMGISPTCEDLFGQAISQCEKLMYESKLAGNYFWKAVNKIFTWGDTTEFMSYTNPEPIKLKKITLERCEALYQNVIYDFVQMAPMFEAKANAVLRLYALIGIILVGCLVFGIKLYKRSKIMKPYDMEAEKYKNVIVKHNRTILNRDVLPPETPRQLIAHDGLPVMDLRANSQFEFLQKFVTGDKATKTGLSRLHDPYGKLKVDHKLEAVKKAHRFVKNYSHMKMLILFDDNSAYDSMDESIDNNKMMDSDSLESGDSLSSGAGDKPRFKGSRMGTDLSSVSSSISKTRTPKTPPKYVGRQNLQASQASAAPKTKPKVSSSTQRAKLTPNVQGGPCNRTGVSRSPSTLHECVQSESPEIQASSSSTD